MLMRRCWRCRAGRCSGTIRANLDPFNEYTEEALNDALRAVEMTEFVEERGGLEGAITDNGGNASIGERQVTCRCAPHRCSCGVLDSYHCDYEHHKTRARAHVLSSASVLIGLGCCSCCVSPVLYYDAPRSSSCESCRCSW
jgi:hypothetical protein